MNLTPTHIPPWLERLGVPLGLGGLVLGLGWYFFVAGVGTGIELRRGQLEALTREIGQGAGLEQQLQDRASRNRRLASRLESLKAALPRGERTARLLRRVQATATGSRLKVKGIRKMPGGEGETFSRRPHSLAVAGDYHDLGSFCEKLGRLAAIVSLEDLRISAAGPAASPHTLTADFTATLHLYKPAADPVEAPADPVSPAQPSPYRYRARGRRDPFRLPQGRRAPGACPRPRRQAAGLEGPTDIRAEAGGAGGGGRAVPGYGHRPPGPALSAEKRRPPVRWQGPAGPKGRRGFFAPACRRRREETFPPGGQEAASRS